MRCLGKEKQTVYISKKLPSMPIIDENGYETGEYYSVYDEPVKLYLNVKPITDIAERQAFGEDVNSILKAVYTLYDVSGYEISEFDAVWVRVKPNGNLKDDDSEKAMNNNYFVYKVLDTGSHICVYFKKIAGASK